MFSTALGKQHNRALLVLIANSIREQLSVKKKKIGHEEKKGL